MNNDGTCGCFVGGVNDQWWDELDDVRLVACVVPLVGLLERWKVQIQLAYMYLRLNPNKMLDSNPLRIIS